MIRGPSAELEFRGNENSEAKYRAEEFTVAIVVLAFNNAEKTIRCLDSISKSEVQIDHLVVVDNASSDETVKKVHLTFPRVHVIENKKNIGFSGGVNVGIRSALESGSDYVWLLNNDVEIEPKAFGNLKRGLQEMKQPCIVGTQLRKAKSATHAYAYGGGFVNHWIGVTTYQKECGELDYIEGSSLCCHAKVFEAIGLFDERFFLYWEDVDFCTRAKKSGVPLVCLPEVIVYHEKSAATRGSQGNRTVFANRCFFRSLRIYFVKHSPASFFPIILRGVSAIVKYFFRGQFQLAWSGVSGLAGRSQIKENRD